MNTTTTRSNPPPVSPRSLAYAGVTHGRPAIVRARDTGCPLYLWHAQKGWIVADVSHAVVMLNQAEAEPAGGMRANAEAGLALYALGRGQK